MIENNMLVIEPASGEKARIPIDKIQEVLTNAYKKCLHDTGYATDKKPWINKAMNVEPLLRSVKVEMTGPVEKVINKNKVFLRAHQGPTGT
jgi:hypothetical protein